MSCSSNFIIIGMALLELGKFFLRHALFYRASSLAYTIWVHKNAMPKNWLMRVKELSTGHYCFRYKRLHQARIWYVHYAGHHFL